MIDFLKKALCNKILWYMATRYLTFALQFIVSIYIATKLGAYHWGVWSFFLLLISIGGLLNWGIGNSINILLIQHKADSEQCARYCFNGFLLSCLIMIPPVLFMIYERTVGIPYFAKYHVGKLIYVILLIVCMGYLTTLFVSIYRIKNRLWQIAFLQSIGPVMNLVLMFWAEGETLLLLLIGGNLVSVLISLLIFLYGGEICWHEKIDFGFMKQIFGKGFMLFCYNACFLLIVLSTKTIISYYYPVEKFGYFAFGFSLANSMMLLIDSFSFLAFPKMIDMLKGKNMQQNIANIKMIRQCYLLVISGLVYMAIPGCWFFLRFIPKYQPAFNCFSMIILALALYPLCYGYNTYMMAQNKEKIMAALVIIALVLNIGISYILASFFQVSMEHCVLGIMIAYFIFASLVNICALKNLHCFSWKDLFQLFPIFCFVPFIVALMLTWQNIQTLWVLFLPLISFLIFSIKSLRGLSVIAFRLLKKPDLLDIKNK